MVNKCVNCGIEVVSDGTKPKKYCSDKCRMAYKRTNANEQTTNEQQTNTFKDAVGREHKIDYEGRLKDFLLLLDWAEGKGNSYQYNLGRTALQYTKSNRIDLGWQLGIEGQELKAIQSRFNAIIESQLARLAG